MAASEHIRPAPFGAIATYRFVNAFSGLFAAVQAWNESRQTRAQLSRLSDRELDDIGLCRADIEQL